MTLSDSRSQFHVPGAGVGFVKNPHGYRVIRSCPSVLLHRVDGHCLAMS